MVEGSNLARTEINFLFAKFSFGVNVKRQRKTLDAKKGSLVGAEKHFANGY